MPGLYGCFLKWRYPQIIPFWYLYFWKHPYYFIEGSMLPTCYKGTRMVQKNLPTLHHILFLNLRRLQALPKLPGSKQQVTKRTKSSRKLHILPFSDVFWNLLEFLDPKKESDIHKKKSGPFLGEDPGWFSYGFFGLNKPKISPAPTNSDFFCGFCVREKIPQNQRKSDEFCLNYLGKFSGQV